MRFAPSRFVLLLVAGASCTRVGFSGPPADAAGRDQSGAADRSASDRFAEAPWSGHDGRQPEASGPLDLRLQRELGIPDLPSLDQRPLDLGPLPNLTVPLTAANDLCINKAIVDFASLQTGTVTMQVNTTGANLDFAYYCVAPKVELAMRIYNNPGKVKFLCQGISGDVQLVGAISADVSCPPSGWGQTAPCGSYALVDKLPPGNSALLLCADPNQHFDLIWSKQ